MSTIQRPNSPAPQTTSAAFWNRFAPIYNLATGSGSSGLVEAAAYIGAHLDRYDVVLDAACGTGAFACELAPRVGFVAACDLSPKMIERAQAKAGRLGLANTAFGTGDICSIDFGDDTFDAAIAGNVLHLLTQPERALSELVRVTAERHHRTPHLHERNRRGQALPQTHRCRRVYPGA